MLASVDGRIGPPGEARISILDEGLIRGDGAFEVIKLYDGNAFRLDAHLARLGRSAASIELDFDAGSLATEIEGLLAEADGSSGCVRVVITRGGRRVLTLEEFPPFPESASIALIELNPSEILAGVKSLSYAANMQAGRIAAARGADEAVFVRTDGIVLEAPTSSVFWTDAEGTLRTPALDIGILDSITRDVLVEGMEVEEGAFDRSALMGAREAFLASTNREIQAISAVDGTAIEVVGGPALTDSKRVLAEAVAARARLNMDLTLSDEQRLISDTARQFADEVIEPRIRESDRAGTFDLDLARRMGEMGYLGAPVSEVLRRPRARLRLLRLDRRAGRPCRQRRPHGDLGPDVAGLRVDRALGKRGAEASAGCPGSAAASSSVASA